MAEVFEAELTGELGFNRKVAIKRMLPEAAADKETADRFLDEARIASRLHHANIVSVLDVGLLDGLPFQVLELVDGINVQQLQSRAGGVLPLEVALIIASDIAHALDHAHNARDAAGLPLGIVHRDVKPSNFMVAWSGDVKLTDFGIAFAHDRAVKTEAGLVPGTMGFIAPEQRKKGEIDGRTDVFALGLSLHAMLTGYTPLREIAVEMDVLAGKPIPLDAMLPSEVRDVIERAITPDRRARLTAAQLADALGTLLAPRLSRDPRGYLRAFLAPLHGNQPKPGMLDQLLGIDVVLAAEPAGDAPRQYALRETAVVRAEALTAADTPASREPEIVIERDPGASLATTGRVAAASIATADSPATGRRVGRIALAAIVVGGLGGAAAWQLTRVRGGSQHAAERSDAPVLVVAGPPDGAVVATVEPDAAPMPELAAPADAAVAAVTAPAASVTRPRPHHSPDDSAPRGAASVAPPPITGTGYLQITGEDNIGARILVDGREVGYAPNKLEVPRGHHAITIVRKDGEKLTGEIDITEYHSVTHPLRPTL